MNDLDSYELDGESKSPELEPPRDPGSSGSRLRILGLVALVALLTIVVGLLWSRRSRMPATIDETGSGAIAREAETAAALVEDEPERPEDLPLLDTSDEFVREAAQLLSEHPKLASWLVSDDLVRRFVVAVDNIAEGQTPRAQLGFMAPSGTFQTAGEEARLVIDPASYRRYDAVAEVFASLDTEGTVELYHRLEPLISEAYEDLGYPERRFEDVLRRAAKVILEAPKVEGPIELERAVRSFHFADDSLESLDPVQKQLLRFGPRNLARVQTKTEALLAALEQSR